jgi:hypothetical protein
MNSDYIKGKKLSVIKLVKGKKILWTKSKGINNRLKRPEKGIHSLIQSFILQYVLWQIHSLYQSEFSTQ